VHHTFHIRFGVAHLAKEICEFLKISNALEAGKAIAPCRIHGRDRCRLQRGRRCKRVGSRGRCDWRRLRAWSWKWEFPWARNREALGILYLEQRDASHALEMFGKALN